MARRRKGRALDGILVLDKPQGISSNQALQAARRLYHAAKAGLQQITRYLAVAAGPYNVRVNSLLPGLIIQERHHTKFNASDNEAYQKLATIYQPLGEVGDEKDVAEAVLYLCSERAKYVSGISLVIDGGATVQEQFGMLLRQLQ